MANETLSRVVSGAIRKRERSLSVPERHQLKVARGSMRMHCAGALIMGGPNHYQSARIIEQLTGAIIGIDADCKCRDS